MSWRFLLVIVLGLYGCASPPVLPDAAPIDAWEIAVSEPGSLAGSGALLTPATLGDPLYAPPAVLRIWVAPWVDDDGDAHDENYSYVVVRPGNWRKVEYLGRIQVRTAVWTALDTSLGSLTVAAPSPLSPALPSPAMTKPGAVTYTVLFPFGSSKLPGAGRAVVDALMDDARKADVIEVVGVADPAGNQRVNDKLATARAEAVYFELLRRGLRGKTFRVTWTVRSTSVEGRVVGQVIPVDVAGQSRRADVTLRFPVAGN